MDENNKKITRLKKSAENDIYPYGIIWDDKLWDTYDSNGDKKQNIMPWQFEDVCESTENKLLQQQL